MAIALDATASGTATTANGTVSLTVGAGLPNSIVIALISAQDSNHANLPVTATFAGTSMTLVRQDTSNNNNVSSAIAYLLSPPAGASNLVVTNGAGVWKGMSASSWSGVSQSGQPDAQAGQGTANQNSAAPAGTITTVAANALIVQAISSEANASSIGAGQTLIGVGTVQGQSFENLCASYVLQAAAGLGTLSATLSSGQAWNESLVSFSPASAAPAATQGARKALMGVGI